MRQADELRALFEEYLASIALHDELGTLAEPIRYALAGGGKRLRPVLCLAAAEALGVDAEEALPAAAAVELVHTFSLVHDDLPALDDDDVRRGRPTVHVEYGEATAILAGDALLAEAFRLALAYDTPDVAREIARATLGMIGGQILDLAGGSEPETLNRLKTALLFEVPIACAVRLAGVDDAAAAHWREAGVEIGLLYQVVDDLLDGDGLVAQRGADAVRAEADERARSIRAHLAAIDADTSVVEDVVSSIVALHAARS